MNIITLTASHAPQAVAVINAAAQWYATFLPPEEWQPPEMTEAQWHEEARRMQWFGVSDGATLAAVLGLEHKLGAALIRHAYVAPERQRQGLGLRLLAHAETQALPSARRFIAGTYAGNLPAQALFMGHGYRLSADSTAILRQYYRIPEARLRTSVTLEKHR